MELANGGDGQGKKGAAAYGAENLAGLKVRVVESVFSVGIGLSFFISQLVSTVAAAGLPFLQAVNIVFGKLMALEASAVCLCLFSSVSGKVSTIRLPDCGQLRGFLPPC